MTQAIRACLFDYGNTVVAFDHAETSYIRTRLARHISDAVSPVDPDTLAHVMEDIYLVPHRGDPPTYVELQPLEQMELVLRRVFGQDARILAKIDAQLIFETNLLLQRHFVESIQAGPDVRATLERLRTGVAVGLVSNYPCGATIRRSIAAAGLCGLFEPIVVSGDVGYVKPHPRPFQAALEALGARPEETLFVGDRWDMDMVGARALGLKTCHHVGHTSDLDVAERYQRYRPDHTIRDLEDLLAIVGVA